MSPPLSRLRLCLLLGLQLEPPVATQPGQAAITPVAVLADSLGARRTFGEEEVSWGCLMWPGTTSAGGCSAAGIEPLPGCCGGTPASAGWDALRAGNVTAAVTSLRHPEGHRQPVPPHTFGRDEGGGGGGVVLLLWPSIPAPAAGSPGHSWLPELWLRLSHTVCQEGKRRRSRETAPGAGVPPMDFNATWHEL